MVKNYFNSENNIPLVSKSLLVIQSLLMFVLSKNGTRLKFIYTFLLLVLLQTSGFGQTAEFKYTGATQTFTPPAGVTAVTKIECWGAGGAGGMNNDDYDNGGGGGGGGYTVRTSSTTVTNTNYTITVGKGGVPGSGTGGNSSAAIGTTVLARGGSGGTSGQPGQGGDGALAGSGGNTYRTGGQGADGKNYYYGGGGGGGGGTGGNGGDASAFTGGTSILGIGGNGAGGNTKDNSGGNGSNASGIGGGGGGGRSAEYGTRRSGGNGANGRVVITYSCPTYAVTAASTATKICSSGGTSTVTLTSTSLPDGTYTVTYSTTNPASSGNTATMAFSGDTGTFVTKVLSAASTITVTAFSNGVSPSTCSNTVSGSNYSASVTVDTPTVSNAGPAQTVCGAGTNGITLAANAVATGELGTWTGTTTFTDPNSPTSKVTLNLGTTTTLTWTITKGSCSSASNVVITNNATSPLSGTLGVCAGQTTTLTSSQSPTNTGNWSSATPSVAIVSSAGVVTGVATGTSVITYVNTLGCPSTATVTVNALLTAPTVSANSKTYTGLANATPVRATAGTAGTIDWYSALTGGTLLQSGTTTGSQTYTPTAPIAAGTYTFYAEARNISTGGCVSSSRTPVTLTINKAVLTVTTNDQTVIYGTSSNTVKAAATYNVTGFVNGEDSSVIGGPISYTTNYGSSTPVGTSETISLKVIDLTATNYNFNSIPGTITVTAASLTITANAQSKTYGTTQTTSVSGSTAFTSTGLRPGETIGSVTLTYAGVALPAAAAVGSTATITPSAATGGTFTASNYTITYIAGTETVTAAALTITANAQSKTYGTTQTTPVSGSTAFTSTGLRPGETIGSVTLTYAGVALPVAAAVGSTATITPSAATGGTFTASNYTITYIAGTETVTAAALTITANAQSKTYGTTQTTPVSGSTAFTSIGLRPGETIGSVTLTYAGAALPAAATVGSTATITPSAATGGTFTASNYTITYIAGTETVTTAALTITANAQSKCYGTALTLGITAFTASGLQNGETITSVTLTSTGGYDALLTQAAGSYPVDIVPSNPTGVGFSASNYNITFVNGDFTINALPNNTSDGFKATKMCAGDRPQLIFDAVDDETFSASYSIKYQNNAIPPVQYTQAIDTSSPFSFEPGDNPTANMGYTLISISNGTCTRTASFGKDSANLIIRPIPTAGISGTTNVCEGDTKPNIVFTNPQSVSITVTYKVNEGVDQTIDIAPSPATSSVTVPTAVAGSFVYSLQSVVYQNTPTCSNPITGSATVTINSAPTLTDATQPIFACDNSKARIKLTGLLPNIASTVSYTIAGDAPQTVSVTADGTRVGYFDTRVLKLSPTTDSGKILKITGVSTASCSTTGLDINVTLNVKSNSGSIKLEGNVISGSTTFSELSTAHFSIDPIAGAVEYNWVVPASWTITAGDKTNAITVTTGPYNDSNITVSVMPSNSFCPSSVTVALSAIPPQAPAPNLIVAVSCNLLGSVTFNNLPDGAWTLAKIKDLVSTDITGSGNTLTVSNLAAGDYTFRITNARGSSVSGIVTIPDMPSTTWNGGAWNVATSWSNDLPDTAKKIILDANGTVSGLIQGCSCEVKANKNIVFDSSGVLKLENELRVDASGSLTFLNGASLVQRKDVDNFGDIHYNRTTSAVEDFDYVYWSSPVSGQKLGVLSPSSDKYWSWGVDNWVPASGSNVMAKGQGYIARVPRYTSPQMVEFVGVPFNGPVSIPSKGNTKGNLIGNPYPCAVDAKKFMDANIDFIKGTLYFWTHKGNRTLNEAGTQYEYSSNDYASYNSSGGAKGALNGGAAPDGTIGAGQSFFVVGDVDNNGLTGDIVFTNSMRVDATNNINSNSQFFKQVNTKKTEKVERNRVWLNLTNEGGAFKQLLVAYITGASNGFDKSFDGPTFNANAFVDFYSINESKKYTIQGRGLPFDEKDEVPLGYKSNIDGTFQISIDDVDGSLVNQAIYLEDKVTNTVHDLKKGSYSFTTAKGEFQDRFVLRYTNTAKLGTGDFDSKGTGVVVSVKSSKIKINSFDETLSSVKVYDLKGSLLYEKDKLDKNEFAIDHLASSNQFMIVMVQLESGKWISEEIIFHD